MFLQQMPPSLVGEWFTNAVAMAGFGLLKKNCITLTILSTSSILRLTDLCKVLHHTHIRVYLDNTTAISVINHMGMSHSQQSNALGKTIWEWCIPRNIWISAAHIPRVDNTLADSESRSTDSHTEWMLDSSTLKSALSQLDFNPNIDIFATRLNAQFSTYVSYRPDPGAFSIDALSIELVWIAVLCVSSI